MHTDVARTPPLGALARFGSDDLFGALGILGPSLAGFRDALGIQEEAATGTWSYPSAPSITFFHVAATPSATGEEAGPVTLQADLVYRARASLPLADAALDLEIHPLVRSGVLDAIAEQMLLAPETRGETEDTTTYATGPTVGAIFAAAAEGNIEIRVIATTADLDAVDADAQSRSLIAAALEAGNVVVAPVQPVTVGGEPVLGWWIVDPATGRTSDQLQDGMGSASTGGIGMAPVLFGPKGEYSLLTSGHHVDRRQLPGARLFRGRRRLRPDRLHGDPRRLIPATRARSPPAPSSAAARRVRPVGSASAHSRWRGRLGHARLGRVLMDGTGVRRRRRPMPWNRTRGTSAGGCHSPHVAQNNPVVAAVETGRTTSRTLDRPDSGEARRLWRSIRAGKSLSRAQRGIRPYGPDGGSRPVAPTQVMTTRRSVVMTRLLVLLMLLATFGGQAAAQPATPAASGDCIVVTEPNDQPADAIDFGPGAACATADHAAGGQDLYRWTVTDAEAGQRWSFDLSAVPGQVGLIEIYTVDLDGDTVLSATKVVSAMGDPGAAVTVPDLLFATGRVLCRRQCQRSRPVRLRHHRGHPGSGSRRGPGDRGQRPAGPFRHLERHRQRDFLDASGRRCGHPPRPAGAGSASATR